MSFSKTRIVLSIGLGLILVVTSVVSIVNESYAQGIIGGIIGMMAFAMAIMDIIDDGKKEKTK
jgi:predicted cobalt transporter CbtA